MSVIIDDTVWKLMDRLLGKVFTQLNSPDRNKLVSLTGFVENEIGW